MFTSHGCAPDVRRANDGHTALLVAAEAGHLQCCRVLLERGADPRIKETTVERWGLNLPPSAVMWCTVSYPTLICLYSRTALDLALVNGHREVADYLISQGVPSGGGTFHRAALTIQAVWRLHRHRVRQNLSCIVSLYMCVCVSVASVAIQMAVECCDNSENSEEMEGEENCREGESS